MRAPRAPAVPNATVLNRPVASRSWVPKILDVALMMRRAQPIPPHGAAERPRHGSAGQRERIGRPGNLRTRRIGIRRPRPGGGSRPLINTRSAAQRHAAPAHASPKSVTFSGPRPRPKSVTTHGCGPYTRANVGLSFRGKECMAIVEEYDAIAKRLRELQTPSAKSADDITHLERWRDLARETARAYVENRRQRLTIRPILPQPTD